MPTLIFKINTETNQWVATVANTDVEYRLIGNTLEDQSSSLNLLANIMKSSDDGLFESLLDVAIDIPNGVDVSTVVAQLFETTDQIMLEERVIYAVVESTDTIFSELIEAGRALEMFL